MGLASGTWTRLKEFARRPTTLALLVVLPPLAIEVYGLGLESFPALAGLEAAPATVGRITGTLFAVAFLSGLVGLFQVISARKGDERLALAGYPRTRLLATRLLVTVAIALVGSAVGFGVLAGRVEVAAPVLAFGALALAALLYGLVGVVVGTLVPKDLEGSLVLVFMADLDNVLSSGLFEVGDLAQLAPLYHPHALLSSAVLDGTVGDGHLGPTLAVVAGLGLVAWLSYTLVGVQGGPRA